MFNHELMFENLEKDENDICLESIPYMHRKTGKPIAFSNVRLAIGYLTFRTEMNGMHLGTGNLQGITGHPKTFDFTSDTFGIV